ncbi:hypothetical protein GC173_14955 [bacterium]|nr:hypothetical protein [bacterium]
MSGEQPSRQLSVADLRKAREAEAQQAAQKESGAVPQPAPVAPLHQQRPVADTREINPVKNYAFEVEPPPNRLVMMLPVGIVALVLLVVIVSAVSHEMKQPGGPMWNRDKVWITQKQVMRLCLAYKLAEPMGEAGLNRNDPFGMMTVQDVWGNAIEKRQGNYRSAGEDGKYDTADDIWADFMEYTYGGPIIMTPDDHAAIEKEWPDHYRGLFHRKL